MTDKEQDAAIQALAITLGELVKILDKSVYNQARSQLSARLMDKSKDDTIDELTRVYLASISKTVLNA